MREGGSARRHRRGLIRLNLVFLKAKKQGSQISTQDPLRDREPHPFLDQFLLDGLYRTHTSRTSSRQAGFLLEGNRRTGKKAPQFDMTSRTMVRFALLFPASPPWPFPCGAKPQGFRQVSLCLAPSCHTSPTSHVVLYRHMANIASGKVSV